MKFLATINTPGYLPWDDDPPTFDTAREAWEYLADARREAEDSAFQPGDDDGFSSIVNTMESLGNGTLSFEEHDLCGVASTGEGSIWGTTPGYYGDHDLGLSYCVTVCEPCDEGEHVVEVDGTECTRCGQPTPPPETFEINERVLTVDTVTWAPNGFTFGDGHTAVVTYHTFLSPELGRRARPAVHHRGWRGGVHHRALRQDVRRTDLRHRRGGVMGIIRAAHYDETEKRLTTDPIVRAMALDIFEGTLAGTITLDRLTDSGGGPDHSFMLAANARYREQGGTDGGHIGAVPTAVLTVVRDLIAIVKGE